MATRNAFQKIMAGLEEMKADVETGAFSGRVTIPDELDVARVRRKTALSQDRFAAAFGINAATLRNWEQKRTHPDGPARVLLTVIDRDPVAVLRALRLGPQSATRGRRPRPKVTKTG
jgi:putative transcriptional regulator